MSDDSQEIERSKINPSEIVSAHLSTLVYFNSNKTDYPINLVLFVIPLLSGFFFLYYFDTISQNLVNILISTFSIFIGLLLNLLLLIYDLTKKFNPEEKSYKLKKRFLKEIFANISYSILVSISIIFFLLISLIQVWLIPIISAFLVYYLTANFFLTILMVLKRIHILLYKEFDTA